MTHYPDSLVQVHCHSKALYSAVLFLAFSFFLMNRIIVVSLTLLNITFVFLNWCVYATPLGMLSLLLTMAGISLFGLGRVQWNESW